MNIAKNWSQISIGQFQQINAAIKNYPDNAITQAVWILSALTENTRDELLALDFTKDFKPLMRKLDWIHSTPLPTQLPKQFELEGENYQLVYDMKQRTTGQFVDLAHFTADPEQIIPNLHFILAVLCIPVGQKNHADGFEQRAKLFQQKLSIAIAYPIATFFFEALGRLVAAYPNLFGTTSRPAEEVVDEDNWFAARYGWLTTIDSVAENRTQWDFYLMMPIVEFLNYLCFLKDKNEYQSTQKHEQY